MAGEQTTADDQPFYLIVTDHDRGVFAVEGPMTDERPWKEAATYARNHVLSRTKTVSQSDYHLAKARNLLLVSRMANLDQIFHSLRDGTRRAVIAQLANGPASVSDLAERHRMALPSFMKHIRVPEGSEIILSRKSGRIRVCELRPDALAAAQSWLEKERRMWESRLDQLDSFVETLAAKENARGHKLGT